MGLASKITDKDWMRMQTLIRQEGIKPRVGKNVADKITKKDKALARFTAGIKLAGFPIEKFMELARGSFDDTWRDLHDVPFYAFWRRAQILGAKPDEVEDLYMEYDIPDAFTEGNNKYVATSDQIEDRFNNITAKFEKVVVKDARDFFIEEIAKKFDRFRIPVKFAVNPHSNQSYTYWRYLHLSDSELYKFRRNARRIYDITIFPDDYFSSIVLTVIGWNDGRSWRLLDYTPADIGDKIGLRRYQDNFADIMRCIKNYLGL